MKIAQIIHGFPPHNMAGSEVYTYYLAQELAQKDEVFVFYRIADADQEEYKMTSGRYNCLNICTINNIFKYCDSFEKTYRNEIISEKFGQFLDKVEPDVAHFGHLTNLSTTLIEEAKKRNIPVIFTLHDFWLFCQLGQLLTRDLFICDSPKDYGCARCLASQLVFNGKVKKSFELLRKIIPSFAGQKLQGNLLRGFLRQYDRLSFLFQHKAKTQIAERRKHIIEMCSLVDLFIAPSNFLLNKFVEFGIPKSKLLNYDYGFKTTPFKNFVKKKSNKIRFGYIGTFIPSKGVHILLEAYNKINSERSELRIHGKFVQFHPGFENYPEKLKALSKRENIKWLGEYNNNAIAEILAEIDVLVVPSIWFENSPLTIHEAFLARVPVITANIGGMAELVKHEETGLLFQARNSHDLATKMQMIVDEPEIIKRLKENTKPVIPMEEHVLKIRELYHSLVHKKNRDMAEPLNRKINDRKINH